MAANIRNAPPVGGAQQGPQSLPFDGFTRWNDLKRFVPLSHESVRKRELAGRFPRRVQLGSARCVAWKNSEVHRWFADPAGYRAPEAA
ncbi:AlpA family phage regulatory protein [Burkholderia stagnalis]|uniref:helix-turn-helix transcriptional regulator n=1 Tax=Burkholderia stagnalis TaxID=1503054 RepID=UPI000F591134|nr:AlpA family phage regulatory protein [Burkholderia stagnalis]RQQ13279.1 AlpA family phage regulatory protein [Burkholderia stagnalis]RQR03980.1 AlpA family phage regulatory protein [Burkholderia stagnalis]RQX93786.1 AlpA family phage regulatory protein [Burkholderia stagnalis]RQY83022.1 AlpA family phage regulatory protein [Burkholderia stagnalis]